jgi:hypothetical protein
MRAATEDTGPRAAFGGFLPVPTAGPDGICTENNYGHFMEPVRDNTCVRVAEDLGQSCERDFNARRFTELSVCRSYQTSFDGCSGDWGNIELGTVTYRHDDGSESKARDLTVAPSSHYLNWDLDRLVNNTGKMGNYGKDGMRSFSNKTYYLNEYLLANSTYRGEFFILHSAHFRMLWLQVHCATINLTPSTFAHAALTFPAHPLNLTTDARIYSPKCFLKINNSRRCMMSCILSPRAPSPLIGTLAK